MQDIKARFIESIPRTQTVTSFRFSPGQKVDFIPGQFLQVIFDESNISNRELNKYLSFSSSPAKEYIEVTKRLSESQFSQRLKSLNPGDEILLKAPLGSCVFKEEYKKICFLIGGIGITPVISILEYLTENKSETDAVLFYSNRTEEEIAFRKELDHWQSVNDKIKIVYALTDSQPKDKRCVFGRIDESLIKSRMSDLGERIVFIFGPPVMVGAMNKLCLDMGCSKDNIKTENFIGY
ncbi:MAG: FAD-dependent oxidoreductase [Candidatus Omnitrophica bacterium]|nr:FAD-dependent oxidoreductase [Candidatus Omnitrophota bacterium]